MEPIPPSVERSVRRSRLRLRVLVMLSSLSEAYPGQLARACGVSVTRLRWVMVGHFPQYAPGLGLVALGLVEEVRTEWGRVYRVTSRGRRKARSLTSSWARRAAGRAVVLEGAVALPSGGSG